jgi:hypothetical protein
MRIKEDFQIVEHSRIGHRRRPSADDLATHSSLSP